MGTTKRTSRSLCAAIMCAVVTPASAATLYAVLELDGNSYRLKDTFATTVNMSEHFGLSQPFWALNPLSFAPIFPTERLQCVINTQRKTDECLPYRDKEARFVYLNSYQSDYGDTQAERKAKEKTTSQRVGAAVGTVVTGALIAPALIVVSPILLLGAAANPESKKWVEFNHDAFNETVAIAVKKAGFESQDDWSANFRAVSNTVDGLISAQNIAFKAAKEHSLQERAILSDYVKVGIRPKSFAFEIRPFKLPSIPIRSGAINEIEIREQIFQHFAAQLEEHSVLVATELDSLKPSYEARLVELAEKDRQAKLRAEEDARQARMQEEERLKQERIAAIEKQKRIVAENSRLTQFRSKLKLGDETHCGPIIEIRGPMIKVAVKAQIQGFASEGWLKINNIYTPEYGCFNNHGTLLPDRSFM